MTKIHINKPAATVWIIFYFSMVIIYWKMYTQSKRNEEYPVCTYIKKIIIYLQVTLWHFFIRFKMFVVNVIKKLYTNKYKKKSCLHKNTYIYVYIINFVFSKNTYYFDFKLYFSNFCLCFVGNILIHKFGSIRWRNHILILLSLYLNTTFLHCL